MMSECETTLINNYPDWGFNETTIDQVCRGGTTIIGNLTLIETLYVTDSYYNYAMANDMIKIGMINKINIEHSGKYIVTALKDQSFSNKNITSVVFPSNITTIGNNAFANNKLTSVTIPDTVTSLGGGAFKNNNLSSVTIPKTITSIGGSTFQNNKLSNVVIPNNITSIGNSAFENNKLNNVTFSQNLTSIGLSAFRVNNITNLVISDSVRTIGTQAFSNNPLKTIVFGESSQISTIGNAAFYLNNPNAPTLTIYNNTKRSFDWVKSISKNHLGESMVTGTLEKATEYPKTIIKEGYPE